MAAPNEAKQRIALVYLTSLVLAVLAVIFFEDERYQVVAAVVLSAVQVFNEPRSTATYAIAAASTFILSVVVFINQVVLDVVRTLLFVVAIIFVAVQMTILLMSAGEVTEFIKGFPGPRVERVRRWAFPALTLVSATYALLEDVTPLTIALAVVLVILVALRRNEVETAILALYFASLSTSIDTDESVRPFVVAVFGIVTWSKNWLQRIARLAGPSFVIIVAQLHSYFMIYRIITGALVALAYGWVVFYKGRKAGAYQEVPGQT